MPTSGQQHVWLRRSANWRCWDAGWGFQIPQVYKSGYTVAALTVVFTAAIWFFAMRGGA